MNGAELVRLITNVLFLVVFVGALRTALRERTRTSVDATILFGALAVVIAQSQIAALLGTQLPTAFGLVSAILLLALPYLQLRLVDDFAGVRPLVLRACLGGFVAGIAALVVGLLKLVVLPAAVPVIVALALLYFVGFCAYGGFVLIREAREAKGVARNRMVAAASGALALSLTLIVAVTSTIVGPTASSIGSMVLALISALGYLVAFAPPVLLKRAWREPALRSFLTRAAAISPHDPLETILRGLEVAIVRAAPGQSARIGLVDEKTEALAIADDEELLSSVELMASVVETQTPRFVRTAAGATLAAPITGRGRRIGVLAVMGRRAPLFASDDLDLRPEIVTLDVLLEPVSAAGRSAAQAKGVLFTMETPEAPSLFLDPTRVRQVLFNLVSNAVKFTPGGGHITLRTFVEGRELRFEVADTGVGIPKSAADRMFGVFERFHEARAEAWGTGW